MKTIIIIVVTAVVACVLFSATSARAQEITVSKERTHFMCSVGTIEPQFCDGFPDEEVRFVPVTLEKPIQVDRARLIIEDEIQLAKLHELIKQLQTLLDALRAQHALKV